MRKECINCPENASKNKKYCDCQYIGDAFCFHDEKAIIHRRCSACGCEFPLKDMVYMIGSRYVSLTKLNPIPIGDFDLCKYCYGKIKNGK